MENSVADVIIVGGSVSGLSAALALGRSGRWVQILDDNNACNKNSNNAYNILMNDGLSPGEIRLKALADVLQYSTVEYTFATVTGIVNQGFFAVTASGKSYYSKTIILCTGIEDTIPNIPGFRECWGKSVIHCPYCHAYEQKGGLCRNARSFGR